MISIDELFFMSAITRWDEDLYKSLQDQSKPLIFDSVIIYSSREILEAIFLSNAEYNSVECYFYLKISLFENNFFIKIAADRKVYPNPAEIERLGERFIYWEVYCRAEDKLSIQYIMRYIYREIIKKIEILSE